MSTPVPAPPSSSSGFDLEHVELLRDNLEWRVAFSRDFLGFTEKDGKTLNSVATIVSPLIKPIVDSVYVHLFEYPYTKAFFLKRNAGFTGELAASLAEMNLDDPQISFRKQFLSVYISKVFKSDFENPVTWVYFDKVAEMHTGLAGFKHRASKDPLVVDLQPMALLLGWVEDVVLHAVMELPNDVADIKAKTAVLSAFNKLMWLQNDLFNRWYAKSPEELAVQTARKAAEGATLAGSATKTAAL